MEMKLEVNGLIDALVDADFSLERIAEFVGAEAGRIAELRGGREGSVPPSERELGRVKVLYLRETIKGLYRKQPYVSQVKGSELLGVEIENFKAVYDSLVRSGAIQERRVKPDWAKHEVLERIVN